MNKSNFFLTDVMKTGDHQVVEGFLNCGRSAEQRIEYTGEYYTLHNYDLKKYDRLFAMIDHDNSNTRLWENTDYHNDLQKRIDKLEKLGFKFILAHPWESEENMRDKGNYNQYLKDKKYIRWAGKTSWFWFLMRKKYEGSVLNFNHSQKKFNFLYLNKQSRSHRKKLFDKLKKEHVLDNSLFSFLDAPYGIKLDPKYELPWVDTQNYPKYGSDQDIYEPQFNDSCFNLISETNDNDHDVFITEKLWKPIIAGQVFIVHGNYNYLKKLRDMGFKTFGDFFDESYDDERDPNRRIDCIVSLCKELKKMDPIKLYQETESIRNHNRNLFFDDEALIKSVKETLSDFFEFSDRS